MGNIYKRLDIKTALWWIFLIVFFIGAPVFQLATGELKINGEVVKDIPIWMYFVAIAIYDLAMIALIIAMGLIGMILTKLYNFITKDK